MRCARPVQQREKPADHVTLDVLGGPVRHSRHDHQIAGADLRERFEVGEDDALV